MLQLLMRSLADFNLVCHNPPMVMVSFTHP